MERAKANARWGSGDDVSKWCRWEVNRGECNSVPLFPDLSFGEPLDGLLSLSLLLFSVNNQESVHKSVSP